MNLHDLHNLTGFAILLSLIAKFIIHYYLDYLHDRSLGLNSILLMPFHYFIPYKSKVNGEYNKLKYLCNFLLLLAIIALLLNVAFGVLIYLN